MPPSPDAPADGVLLIDKPSGPSSHDVVARVRRALRERRIGHTGTLDPLATGLLPLVIGKATRLAPLLAGHDKTYDATIRLGQATETDDALGAPVGSRADDLPSDDALVEALVRFRGTFEQRPPAYSAKRVGGVRAYALARQAQPVALSPVQVTVRTLDLRQRDGSSLVVTVTATAGFYVRSLARDLGAALGCGAHLEALRRTGSGWFQVAAAHPLEEVEAAGAGARALLISPENALPDLPAVVVAETGLQRVLHGNWIDQAHVAMPLPTSGPVKILAPDGRLIALARVSGGTLHPSVVLG